MISPTAATGSFVRHSLPPGVYLVADWESCRAVGRDPEWVAVEAARAGCPIVQLRAKPLDEGPFLELARRCREALAPYPATRLIINDALRVAAALPGVGLHIGQQDMTPTLARAQLGPTAMLGLSLERDEDLDVAMALPYDILDYVACSPVLAPKSKADAAPPFGLDGLARMVVKSPWPVVAIGGVTVDSIRAMAAAGARMAAVVSAICQAPDPGEATRALAVEFEAGRRALSPD